MSRHDVVLQIDEVCRRVAAGRGAARELAALVAAFGLKEAEFRLLWVLFAASSEPDQTQLAERLGCSPAQVSGLVEQQRALGRLEGRAAAGDRRRQVWRLTAAGRALVEQIVAAKTASEGGAAHDGPRLRVVHGVRTATLLLLLATVGCSRTFYREQADDQASCLINQKAAIADADPGSYSINVDPRSRMFDPYDPDCEPQPPDDPTAHLFMECVDGKKGSKKWDKLPKTPFVENPAWLQYLPTNESGEVVLDEQGAVELALLESPRYQSQLEELYLSALDVSFERFRFDTQFFGGTGVYYTADGKDRSGSGESSSQFVVYPSRTANPALTSNRFRAERLFATGGELVVGFANSLVWQFAGPDDYSSNTVLDFSLVQPLLRLGGRTRVLERLTISERTLLANVRQMERFRRNFYVSVLTGRDPGQGPSRRGGVFGGSGLEGFSGVGGGGFGRVGIIGQGGFGQGGQGGGGGGGGFTGGAGAQGAGGYLGLLQTAQVLRNQRSNVLALSDSVEQLQASYEAGRIDRFQVDLARQALYNAQSQLLTSEMFYQITLDSFKTSIGLPPELNVKIQDPLLDRLNLIDPTLEDLQQLVVTRLTELRDLRETLVGAEVPPPPPGALNFPEPAQPAIADGQKDLSATLSRVEGELDELLEEAEARLADIHADFDQLDEALPARRAYLKRLAGRPEVQAANIDPALFSTELLDERVAKNKADFAEVEKRLRGSLAELTSLADSEQEDQRKRLDSFVNLLSDVSGQLLELSLVQASARLESITFSPVDITDFQALAIASVYRRDWMNARASLVDTWRLIWFNANDLLSGLNVTLSGDIGNVGDNPFNLQGSRGRLRAGLEFDAPLTRLAERNVYRQSLIEFQQARRNYYQFRDQVYQGLRDTLRQIRLDEVNFELRRAAVQVAISQVDLTQLRLSEPPQPGAVEQFNNTTARDLVQSLSDLLNVQNDFLSVWVNYQVQRLGLEADLGVMELAPNGLRIENGIPLEMYLVNLPYNSCDLGLAEAAFVASQPVKVVLDPEESKEVIPLPLPVVPEEEDEP
jgi:DNA-binding MarR family transcriptional regulator